jgi:hypothetical protein
LSLVPGIGTAASLGLDAANIYRDYKAGKFGGDGGGSGGAPGGTTGGDQKLQQLQKIIGAKPDGLMGPETKAKLQAWQQKNGLTPDGMPGPQTYGKAGIKETTQTVAEGIRNLQERLALIETKATIKESIAGRRYFLDENCFMFDENGEQVTDLVTIAAINEAYVNGEVEVDEGIWSDLVAGGKAAYQGAKNFASSAFKGAANPAAAEKLAARGGEKLAAKNLSKAGLKTGATLAKNPVKTALGATALGVGTAAALGGNSGTTPTADTGGPGGGGSQTGTTTDTPTTDTPTTDTTTTSTDPKVADLVKQIKDLMMLHGEQNDPTAGDNPNWVQATSHARAVLDKAEKTNPAQTKSDQQAALSDKTQPSAATQSGAGGAGSSTGTTIPTQTITVPKVPAGTTVDKNGVKESAEDELARWLKIARG